MQTGSKNQPLFWGLLHGINDMTAGYLLAVYTWQHQYESSFWMVSLYAIIGFGGQLPAGFWLDKYKNLPLASFLSTGFLLLALSVSFFSTGAAIIISGLASAFVHITGGVICLQASKDKMGPLGLFTAPGVLGLTAGGLLGGNWALLPVFLLAATVLLTIGIFSSAFPVLQKTEKKESPLDQHDRVMLLILLLMCFRSFLFDVVNYVAENYEDGILFIGLSAFGGKLLGGYAADRFGPKKFIYTTLVAALILFQFGKENLYALCAGIVFLQSSVPVTLLMMSKTLPDHPATASAFSLGISLILVGLPLFLVSDKRIFHDFLTRPGYSTVFFILFLATGVMTTGIFIRKFFLNKPG